MSVNITNYERNKLKSHFIGVYEIPEIISYIDEITNIYNYKYENLIIKVYYRNFKDKINIPKIQNVIKRAYKVVSNMNNIKIFNIHLILSPAKKRFEYNNILTAKCINSGFTYPKGNDIFIFREEEFPKVIIHELLHHQKLIDNQIFDIENKYKLMNHFNINNKTKLILNETIIELCALILHLSFISNEYNLDIKDLFIIELKYSLFKCYQILKLQQTYKNEEWYDECNIYCYIIFKTIIMFHLNEFIRIYSYPYDNTKITKFIIEHSNIFFDLKKQKSFINPEFI